MSALSLLAFVTGLAAKVRPPAPDVEITKLKARVKDLDEQVCTWMRLTESWRERAEDWRRRAQLSARERYDLELRDRAMLYAYAQQQTAQLGQQGLAQQQMALTAQQPMGLAYMGQEAQAMWCNCVPSRSQVWAAQQNAQQNLERSPNGSIAQLLQVSLDALTDTPSSRQGD